MKNRLLFVACLLLSSICCKANALFGLTNTNQILVMADANAPAVISGPYNVVGVVTGQTLVALDVRPSTGRLYGLGYNAAIQVGQVYTITQNGSSFTATAVNAAQLNLSLGNGSIGLDFNSINDVVIQVTSTNGYSYNINATTGMIMNYTTGISYAVGDVNAAATAHVAAIANSNSFYGADATTTFGYDAALGVMVWIDAVNNDSVHTIGVSGIIGLAPGSGIGMDMYYNASAHTNNTYLTATTVVNGGAHLYSLDNNTGFATDLGAIGTGNLNIRDIAIAINNNIPATITGTEMIGLSLNLHNLIVFDSDNPSVVRNVIRINGITNGQDMVAIDVRPSDLRLYGLGYNHVTTTYQLYTIDLTNGNAVAINASPATLNLGTAANTVLGFDFNPLTDHIRIVGNNGINVEMNADNATYIADSNLNYAIGDINFGANTAVSAIAHTNNDVNATSTALLGIDNNTGALINLGSGPLNVGNNGSLLTMLNISTIIGTGGDANGTLDIYYNNVTNTDLGYLAANLNGYAAGEANYSDFYTVNTLTGSTTLVGSVGPGVPVRDIAAKQNNALVVNNVTASNSSSLLMYPNPVLAQTRIALAAPSLNTVNVDVIDLNGRVMRSAKYGPGTSQLDIDMSMLATGLYTVRVMEKGQPIQYIKAIKQEP